MSTQIRLSDSQPPYLVVTQQGALTAAAIKQARHDSLPFFPGCDRVLVDYRQADLSGLELIEIDTLSSELKRDVPDCRRMAIIRTPGRDARRYTHLMNVCLISGITTALFEAWEPAHAWLIEG